MELHSSTKDFDTEPENENLSGNLRPGTTLGKRYLIQGVLGVGGMGAVYRARDLHFPNVIKLVAVKEMYNSAPDPMVAETMVQTFEREANLLATLDHRAIPRIYDYFSLNNRSYLVLEYIQGKDLEAIILDSSNFLPEERVLAWALELCDVLQFLHNQKPDPVIFRDMKPSNIMINNQDHVVLVDFGIAKTFQAGQKGTMIGTEGYSPPEQYRGHATPLADIYALGATIHHAVTRRDPRLEPPFSFQERPVRSFNMSISPEFEAVINKALNYEPADRYQSAEEFRTALLEVAESLGIPAYSSLQGTRTPRGEIRPIWTFRCEDEVRGTPTVHGGSLYVGSYDNNLYAIEASTGKFQWKYPTEGGIVSRPAIFDGNVVFGSEDHRVYVLNARTGRLHWIYYTDEAVRSSPTVAEGHIFIGSDDRRLHAINAVSGRQSWRADTGAPIRSTPLVENESVFFGSESGEFYCLDFSGGIRWRFSARKAITSSPAIINGVIIFGSTDSTLYALDASSGWAVWRFRMDRPTISSPTINEGMVYFGSVDKHIYCLEASSSREVWRFETGHQVTGSPLIYKDSLYCGSVDGNLYCLDHTTGRLRWRFQTAAPITGSPTAADNMIFVGSTDRNIYALMA